MEAIKAWHLSAPFHKHRHRRTSRDRRSFLRIVYAGPGNARQPGDNLGKYSLVMIFGGSSIASSQRMREVAEIVITGPG